MIDKDLFRFLGGNKKYVFLTVAVMAVGLLANVSIGESESLINKGLKNLNSIV